MGERRPRRCSRALLLAGLLATLLACPAAMTLAQSPLPRAAPRAAPPSRAEAVRRIDSIAAALLASTGAPGLSVAVVHRGDTLAAKGVGLADRERGTPSTERTVHQLGSIGKQFLAATVMRLSENGVLSLDDPVSRHLPDQRAGGDSVRLRHLLHQTSGIRELFTLPGYGEGIGDTTRTTAELLAMIAREPLGFAPGSRWSYSNSNYTLLAAVVERVTGKPYERVIDEQLFTPLGLGSMRQCSNLPTDPSHARGYWQDDSGRVVPSAPENMRWIRGDGGLCGDVMDLARWTRLLHAGRAVSTESYRRMIGSTRLADGTTPDYGYALSLVPLDRRRAKVSHGGRMAGFTGTVAHYPDDDLTIALLVNRGGVDIEPAEAAIARAVLGMEAPAVRERPSSPAERVALAGEYDIGPFAARVVERDGSLRVEMPAPGPTSRLVRVGPREYVAERAPESVRLTFEGPAERATGFVMLMAGMHWYGKRVR